MKKLSVLMILAILCSLLTLSACGDKEPPSEEDIIQYLYERYGQTMQLTSKESLVDIEGERIGRTSYHFHSDYGFDFDVLGELNYTDGIAGIGAGFYQNIQEDYMRALIATIKPEIEKVEAKYASTSLRFENRDDGGVTIWVTKYSQLNMANECIYLLIDWFQENYQIQPTTLEKMSVGMRVNSEVKVYNYGQSFAKLLEIGKETNLTYWQIQYLDLVREGIIKDKTAKTDILKKMPTVHLDHLYINGEEFTSEKYPVKFVYSPVEEDYLAVCAYGIELEYNGGVLDYMQREIITDVLGGSYEVSEKKNITTYTINGHTYEIYMPRKNGRVTDEYYFKKDGETLEIHLAQTPAYYGTLSATYYNYMTLHDWASLLEMEVTIKKDESAVYLTY